MNLLGLAAFAFGIASGPVYGGGVLLCNEYGCRSSPYFPPPIVRVGPPVVYMPANPPEMISPRLRLPPPAGVTTAPVRPAYPPARVARPTAQSAPASPLRSRPDVPVPDPEAAEVQDGILAFCGQPDHSSEPFCVKLGDYLAKHPEARPR